MTMWRISIPAGSEGSVCSRTLSSALTGSRGWPPPPCWLRPSGGLRICQSEISFFFLQGQSKSIGRRYSLQGGKQILGFHWEGDSDGFHNPYKAQTTSVSARQVGLKSERGRLKNESEPLKIEREPLKSEREAVKSGRGNFDNYSGRSSLRQC